MKNIVRHITLLLIAIAFLTGKAHSQLMPNLGEQRVGISSLSFLKIGAGARGVGMGETFVAVANDVSALYWNPAGLTQFADDQVIVSHTEYVLDIKHEFFGGAYHLSPSDVVGFSVTSLHMDEMKVTTTTQPFGTGEYFTFGDIALGLSYARSMTDQFSFGVTVKYIQETDGLLKMRGMLVDLGTYYWTGISSTRFAVVVSNFGANFAPTGEITLENDTTVSKFQSFSPPTLFKFGIAWDPIDAEGQKLTTTIELNHPNDNSENFHIGVEYIFNDWLAFRAGTKRTIEQQLFGEDNTGASDVTFGLGVTAPTPFAKITFDYAYANFNMLGNAHRISLKAGF